MGRTRTKKTTQAFRKLRFLRVILAGLLLTAPMKALALNAPPNPPESVLIIYQTGPCGGDGSWNQTGALRLRAALLAMPGPFTPAVTTLGVPCNTTTSTGIYTALSGAGLSLSSFCEVWDVRFLSNPPTNPCATQESDVVTSTGANNDTSLYESFLSQGGHLYLNSDNGGFCPRNNSVINFINSVTGCSLPYPNTFLGTKNWTTFSNSAPDNFGTNDNTLANLYTYYPGEIPLTSLCGATPFVSDGTYALSMMWYAASLTTGNGKLFVDMDTNSYTDSSAADIPDSHYIQYYQNVYTALAGCFNYSMTKAIVGGAASVCLGSPVTFTICLNNTGSKTLPAPQIVDTLSTCFTYTSSNPSSTQSGSVVTFTLPDVASGASTCVSIMANVNTLSCAK